MSQIVFIKPACKRAGVTLSELADYIGMSRDSISKIANGFAYPKQGTIEAIAQVLNVPVWHLFVNPEEGVPYTDAAGEAHCPYCDNVIRMFVGRHPQTRVKTYAELTEEQKQIRKTLTIMRRQQR